MKRNPTQYLDSPSGFSDPLSPVSDALTVPTSGTEVSEDLYPENAELRFEELNEVTLKLTDGGGSNIPSSHGLWGGYRAARALAWVINVGWLAVRQPLGRAIHNRQSKEGRARDGRRPGHGQAAR